MYNAEIKNKFISSLTNNNSTRRTLTTTFNLFEKHERLLDRDICAQTKEEIEPIINQVLGVRNFTQTKNLALLRSYCEWCLSNNIEGATDGILKAKISGLDLIRKRLVSGPLQLQKYLDDVFRLEEDDTIDNVYRCYFWLAFSGVKESDALNIKISDVHLDDREIYYFNSSVPIYEQSIKCIKKCMELQSFVYIHPKYSSDIQSEKQRVDGDALIRGMKKEDNANALEGLKVSISRRVKASEKNGNTDMRLSYSKVFLSGIFYRMYERERAGYPADFRAVAIDFMEGKEYKFNESLNNPEEYKINAIARNYLADYTRWKLAYMV